MRLCDEVLTVFNAKLDTTNGYDVYHGTVIRGASWYGSAKDGVDKSGPKQANEYVVRIPIDAKVDGGKSYTDPKQYGESDPSKFFTLRPGDIVVHGEVNEADPRPGVLREQYEAFTVLSVTPNTRTVLAPHWKVVGR